MSYEAQTPDPSLLTLSPAQGVLTVDRLWRGNERPQTTVVAFSYFPARHPQTLTLLIPSSHLSPPNKLHACQQCLPNGQQPQGGPGVTCGDNVSLL